MKQVFNKSCPEVDQQQILQHSLIQAIDGLCEVKEKMDAQLKQLITYLEYHIIRSVQNRLPQTLQNRAKPHFLNKSVLWLKLYRDSKVSVLPSLYRRVIH